ncbi:MAG TPA: F0F1 ATP synthase subunit delta [Chthoniobacterales bacterium]|nr:F0F1 ATP synthase subunit delta [Chthoniobacterales bacterium]
MKISKDVRQLSRKLVRASFVDGVLDSEKIKSLVQSIIAQKPRSYLQLLENYQRLLRLEVEKQTATIESATELDPDAGRQIADGLRRKYGKGLTTEFVVNPALLGGVRIRVGSDVWDSSVRNRLDRLQQKL